MSLYLDLVYWVWNIPIITLHQSDPNHFLKSVTTSDFFGFNFWERYFWRKIIQMIIKTLQNELQVFGCSLKFIVRVCGGLNLMTINPKVINVWYSFLNTIKFLSFEIYHLTNYSDFALFIVNDETW